MKSRIQIKSWFKLRAAYKCYGKVGCSHFDTVFKYHYFGPNRHIEWGFPMMNWRLGDVRYWLRYG